MTENYRLTHLDITPEEFYNDKDSVYIRLTYLRDIRGFKVALFNQIDVTAVNDDLMFMATLCRGLAESALSYPAEMLEIGKEAQAKDIAEMKAELSPEQRELMDSEPEGSA